MSSAPSESGSKIPHNEAQLLQSNIHWIDPGATLEGEITHQGEELGYLLEGELEITIAGRVYKARVGDSFHFRSELSHGYRNANSKPARVICGKHPADLLALQSDFIQ